MAPSSSEAITPPWTMPGYPSHKVGQLTSASTPPSGKGLYRIWSPCAWLQLQTTHRG